jgi:hypothetical protein
VIKSSKYGSSKVQYVIFNKNLPVQDRWTLLWSENKVFQRKLHHWFIQCVFCCIFLFLTQCLLMFFLCWWVQIHHYQLDSWFNLENDISFRWNVFLFGKWASANINCVSMLLLPILLLLPKLEYPSKLSSVFSFRRHEKQVNLQI